MLVATEITADRKNEGALVEAAIPQLLSSLNTEAAGFCYGKLTCPVRFIATAAVCRGISFA